MRMPLCVTVTHAASPRLKCKTDRQGSNSAWWELATHSKASGHPCPSLWAGPSFLGIFEGWEAAAIPTGVCWGLSSIGYSHLLLSRLNHSLQAQMVGPVCMFSPLVPRVREIPCSWYDPVCNCESIPCPSSKAQRYPPTIAAASVAGGMRSGVHKPGRIIVQF